MSTPLPDSSRRDRTLPRAVTILLGLAGGVIVVAGMHSIPWILGPTLLALVISIAVQPLQTVLTGKVPRWVATAVCVTVVYVVLVALVIAIVVATARFVTLTASYQDQFDELVSDATDWFHHLGVSSSAVGTVNSSLDLTRITSFLTQALSSVASIVSALVLVFTLLLFMAVDGAGLPARLAEVGVVRPSLVAAMLEFAHTVRVYLIVSTVFGLIVAALDTIALQILGVPAPLLWGLLAFLTNYIPNIGFVIGLIPPAVLALLDSGAGEMVAVIVIYCVINLILQSVIQPKVVGDTVGLSTTLTFLSLVFWAWVLGPVGAILAVPMTLLVRAFLVDADPESRWVLPLVSNRELNEERPSLALPVRRAGKTHPRSRRA